MIRTPTCHVTIHREHAPRTNARGRGERIYTSRLCGEPVVEGGLCAQHLADRERLGGGK